MSKSYSKLSATIFFLIFFQFITAPVFAIEWERITGAATDIGVGPDGSVWIVGTKKISGGYEIYRWTGDAWEKKPGGAVRVGVGSAGHVWVINNRHQIYRWAGNDWQLIPGGATDIGVGSDGSVWVVSTNKTLDGFEIYQWMGTAWTKRSGGAVGIGVGSADNVWAVNNKDEIYHWVGQNWYRMPGSAKDIGVGSDGSIWIVGTKMSDNGSSYNTLWWGKNGWEEQSKFGTRISVGNTDRIWTIDSDGGIWKLK